MADGGRWFDPLGEDERPFDDLRDSTPPRLGEALTGLVGRRGWAERLRGARVHDLWERIAGTELARHIEPVRLHGGVLVLRASSSVWATQVQYLQAELVARANAELGEGQVQRVTVVTGRLKDAGDDAQKRR